MKHFAQWHVVKKYKNVSKTTKFSIPLCFLPELLSDVKAFTIQAVRVARETEKKV